MSSRTLELGKLHLALASERLKLDIASSVDIRFQSGWSPSLSDDDALKALTSGSIWVFRGRRCRVDIEVSFNGKPVDRISRISVLESLGYHLRDAQLWSQLSLSTSLEIAQSEQLAQSPTDFSICINHEIFSAKTQPKAWFLDNIDIKAPESMLCARFERLRIQMNFCQIQRETRVTSKRTKLYPAQPDRSEVILLNHSSGLKDNAHLICFENFVAGLHNGLSGSTAKGFQEFDTHESGDSPDLLDEMLLPLRSKASDPKGNFVSIGSSVPAKLLGKRSKAQPFPKETIEKLRAWLDAHPGNSSPTTAERLELMKQTGMQKGQLASWFCNRRRRQRNGRSMKALVAKEFVSSPTVATLPSEVLDEKYGGDVILSSLEDDMFLFKQTEQLEEDDMLLTNVKDEMLFDEQSDYPDEDEMLLSKMTSTVPSLTSQTLTTSTASSNTSLKRPAQDESIDSNSISILANLPLKPANTLSIFGMQTLIAGPSNRQQDLRGIKLRKSPRSTSLAILVPSMFCPGFREVMAHNSKFLPTISNAISSSWIKNVQGEALRSTLLSLSNAKISEYTESDSEEGSVERLGAVVQARIWRMMQKALHNEGSTRKLWKKNKDADTVNTNSREEGGEDVDLLGQNEDRPDFDDPELDFKDYVGEEFIDDDNDIFDDLLDGKEENGSDNDLSHYLEEQERLAVEAETDEMLFGPGCDDVHNEHVEEDVLLLGGSGQKESMLL